MPAGTGTSPASSAAMSVVGPVMPSSTVRAACRSAPSAIAGTNGTGAAVDAGPPGAVVGAGERGRRRRGGRIGRGGGGGSGRSASNVPLTDSQLTPASASVTNASA